MNVTLTRTSAHLFLGLEEPCEDSLELSLSFDLFTFAHPKRNQESCHGQAGEDDAGPTNSHPGLSGMILSKRSPFLPTVAHLLEERNSQQPAKTIVRCLIKRSESIVRLCTPEPHPAVVVFPYRKQDHSACLPSPRHSDRFPREQRTGHPSLAVSAVEPQSSTASPLYGTP